jgi:RimJ/RimL family protein N-acetyltransferase
MSGLPPGQTLTDGVVLLRSWTEDDAPELAACIDGDEEISRWLDRIPQPYSVADALAYLRGEAGVPGESKFAVTDAADGRVLGGIGVGAIDEYGIAEIGYWLRADARGRGATTRALRLVADWALTAGAARVQLRAAVGNDASRRVAEKAGFTLEGVLRSAYWSPRLEQRVDWAMYSVLPGEL